jgi:hypothetical protein
VLSEDDGNSEVPSMPDINTMSNTHELCPDRDRVFAFKVNSVNPFDDEV